MAWWTGKTEIAVCAWGDSNMVALGSTPGVQTDNANVFCYASASGQVPYSEANIGWRNLSNDGASRVAEYVSYASIAPNTGFIGQLLGSNGAPVMQIGNTLQVGTSIDTYLYQVASPGMTSVQFSSGACWDTIARTAQDALDAIPGTHTHFDVVITDLCGNDMLSGMTDEDYYTNMRLTRQNMIDAGWWVPNTTRFVMMEMPRIPLLSDFPLIWKGLDFMQARFNDRVGRANSIGLVINPDDPLPVHFVPASNTELGRRAGDLLLADLPKQQSTFSIGGVRLSLGGEKLRVFGG